MHTAILPTIPTLPTVAEARAAHDLACYGGASHEAQCAAFASLVAALRREEPADRKAARLRVEADNLWDRAQAHRQEWASWVGRVAYRVDRAEEAPADSFARQADLEMAASFERRADAAMRCAQELEAQSHDAAVEAALIEARIADAEAMAGIVAPPPGPDGWRTA